MVVCRMPGNIYYSSLKLKIAIILNNCYKYFYYSPTTINY